jgi:hypothetical protein
MTFPQFNEVQTKIVGPLTFRQFVYVALGTSSGFALYLTVGRKNFLLFLFLAALIFIIVVGLAFMRIEGRDLPTVIKNIFRFGLGSKIYLWRKTETPIVVFQKFTPRKREKKTEEDLPLKIAGGSQLKKIKTLIEMKTR